MVFPYRLLFILIVTASFFISCKNEKNTADNWVKLFNGKNLDGWTVKINGYPLNENIHNTFRVENGTLKVSYDDYGNFGTSYGHIFYESPFSNYRLKLQYRFVDEQVIDGQEWAKKNSGIMIHCQSPESMVLNQGFPVSLEMQLLGGINENEERPTGNLCTPGTHVIMNGELTTEHCINSLSKTFYGEEWINVEVEVYNDSLITHKINGDKVISYSKPTWGGDYTPDSDEWKSKEGQSLKRGYISLQSESHPIEFKNIEILILD